MAKLTKPWKIREYSATKKNIFSKNHEEKRSKSCKNVQKGLKKCQIKPKNTFKWSKNEGVKNEGFVVKCERF